MKVDLFWDEKEEVTKFRLLEPIDVTIDGKEYTIPAGYESDGASIPKMLHGWADPLDPRYLICFLKHDFRL